MLDPSGASKDIRSFVRYLEYCCSCDPEPVTVPVVVFVEKHAH
ncbi:hypothetical protein F443_15003 [Phytophthora nicotianae P1569]|uniref:Uncharacterized protein n=1 Tax=Phytophthora nicotianae P1569 TaxID=1317065 RepID=V9EMX3_PHYNI|nr:hypothetical protein F443_15003 [Phytophthora nicotianae P1569]